MPSDNEPARPPVRRRVRTATIFSEAFPARRGRSLYAGQEPWSDGPTSPAVPIRDSRRFAGCGVAATARSWSRDSARSPARSKRASAFGSFCSLPSSGWGRARPSLDRSGCDVLELSARAFESISSHVRPDGVAAVVERWSTDLGVAAAPARPSRSRRRGGRAARQPRDDRPQRVRGRGRCPGRRRRLGPISSIPRPSAARSGRCSSCRSPMGTTGETIAWLGAQQPPRRRCDARGGPAVLGGRPGRPGRCRRRQRALRRQRGRGSSRRRRGGERPHARAHRQPQCRSRGRRGAVRGGAAAGLIASIR